MRKKLKKLKSDARLAALSQGPCLSPMTKPTGDPLTNDLILNPLTSICSEIGPKLRNNSYGEAIESIKFPIFVFHKLIYNLYFAASINVIPTQ